MPINPPRTFRRTRPITPLDAQSLGQYRQHIEASPRPPVSKPTKLMSPRWR